MALLPVLTVDRWTLRPLRPDDAEAWLAIVQAPELLRLTSWSVDSVDELRASIVAITEGPRHESTRRWAIVDDSGALIGTGGFKAWDREGRTAEIVYELAPEVRGRGVMTAIAPALVEHGREAMQLETIAALVMVDNPASRWLLERLGFEVTETLPAYRECGGVRRDFVRYALKTGPATTVDDVR